MGLALSIVVAIGLAAGFLIILFQSNAEPRQLARLAGCFAPSEGAIGVAVRIDATGRFTSGTVDTRGDVTRDKQGYAFLPIVPVGVSREGQLVPGGTRYLIRIDRDWDGFYVRHSDRRLHFRRVPCPG